MKTTNHRTSEDNESNMSQQLVSKYLPYWPLFILVALLAMAAAYVYLRYATPIYEASATILIKDEKKGTEDSKLLESLNLIATKKLVENEIEVLQSRVLMESVVKKLYLYAPITQKGKVKESDAYTLSPVTIEARNPDSMGEAEKVPFSYDKNTKTILLNGKDKYPINEFVSTPYGTLKFSSNPYYSPSTESEKQLFFSLIDPRVIASILTKGLKITSARQSAILDISFRDAIPQRAVNILTQLIDIYGRKSIEDKNMVAKSTLAFVNEQLGILGKDLDSIEKKVQHFKSGSDAVNIGAQGELVLQNVADNDKKLGDVSSQLAMLNKAEELIVNKQGGILPSTMGVDNQTAAMMNKLYSSEQEYNNLKATVGENNPKMLALAEEINKMRPTILENIRNQRASLSAAKQSLYSTNSGYTSMLRAVPQKEQQLLQISREQQATNDRYQFLLVSKQNAEIALASGVATSQIIDSPMAGQDPVSPKGKLIYMMAVIGALGFCVGIITIKDSFTGKIKYRNEIEKMTSIPIIGEIAFDKSNTPLVIEKGTRSFVAEEFRKLRISLSFLGIDSGHKKLLVTSSISGEGKSFIAANLAVSISLTGKKVALVDMDLNNPSLSRILNVNQEYGVTELLTGEKKVDEVIEKLEGHDSLYFISAGNLPENPTELLANGKINAIIDYLESNFDMVVIDTSPAVLVTDAYILSGLCNATLYVIRHNYSPKMLVKRIDENNQINPINNPAIVFNGVKTRGVFKNNYGYGYDYVYGNKDRGTKTKKVS
jgi:capsular exopolysaccharide synthesis family protein